MTAAAECVLVVDDNPINREMLGRRLEQDGYAYEYAENGVIALEKLAKQKFDLVLLDIMMPHMNGFEVLETMQADPELRQVPVIVISAIDDIQSTVRCLELGAEDYLPKPFNAIILKARVSSSLEKSRLRKKEIQRLLELNAMKDQFVGTVSHDLRNPITSILGFIDLIKTSETIDDEQTLNFLGRIQQNAYHMMDLINDLLDIATIEAGLSINMKEVNLASFLSKQYENFQMMAERKNIDFIYEVPESENLIHIDENRFGQVIGNLVSNAIKYTPEGGQVRLSAHQQNKQIVIEIEDTGLGIPEKDIPHLFDKFFRVGEETHRQVKGTGLGLSIVKAIIDAHEGIIEVESELGQGSVFRIMLMA